MRKLIYILVAFILCLVLVFQFTTIKRIYYQVKYDFVDKGKDVESFEETNKILDQFESRTFKELPENYLKYSNSVDKKFKKMLNKGTYKVVRGDQIFKKLVGKYRVLDFMTKDSLFYDNLNNIHQDKELFWLVNIKLYQKFQQLRSILKKKGFDPNGFEINHGHRHPAQNKAVGGANKSRHIAGEAIDLQIKDVNTDGQITQEDKSIVLDILEKEVIRSEGGIGKYPGTMVIHFDVRGYRARWDSY